MNVIQTPGDLPLTAADQDAAPTATPRRTPVRIAIAVVLIAGAAAWGAHWWTAGRFVEDTDDAYVGGDVTVIASKVAGYVHSVAVDDNQVVHRGDLLVKIDDRDYRAAVAQAEAGVAAARALLVNLDATGQLQRSVIAQADAGVSAATAETTRARLDDARYRDLASRSAVSVESAQRALAAAQTAQAGQQRAAAAQQGAQRQLGVIDSQRKQAEAALAQAQAELDVARLNLSYTELCAPVDGVIGNRRARVGAYATSASQLLVVVPSHGLWIDANFKEDQLGRLRVGQAVEVTADVEPGRAFHGHVVSLAPATGAQFSVLPPENATGNFTKIVQRVPVRISLDGKDGDLDLLRPGLSVKASIDTKAS
jgi:membrane fusion protein (multidrug efflux system)